MSIKVKFKGDKAIIRWNHPMEKEYLKSLFVGIRDGGSNHPTLYVKDDDGREIRFPKTNTPAMMEKPVVVTPKPKSVEKDFQVYTINQLEDEGKTVCRECKHSEPNSACHIARTKGIQPDEFYRTINGSIIGCKFGEKQ